MVSDSELIDRLREFLRNSDLDTTTTGIVRRQLEEDFGVDLSERKAFIREQVDLFLQAQFEEQGQNEIEQGEGEDGDEDDQAVNVKSEENDVDDDGEEVESKLNNGKSKTKRRSSNNEGKKRGGGFSKLCNLSPQLQEFMGVPQLARTEVVKQLWAYIREKDLQDPNNRKNIICDEPLRALFCVDSINMFQMNKALSKHIWPIDSQDAPVDSAPKEKQRKQEREDSGEPKRKEKRQKGEKSGFLAPLPLSDALIKFLGTGENALSRLRL